MTTRPFFVNSFGERYLYDVNRGAFNQIGAANVEAIYRIVDRL